MNKERAVMQIVNGIKGKKRKKIINDICSNLSAYDKLKFIGECNDSCSLTEDEVKQIILSMSYNKYLSIEDSFILMCNYEFPKYARDYIMRCVTNIDIDCCHLTELTYLAYLMQEDLLDSSSENKIFEKIKNSEDPKVLFYLLNYVKEEWHNEVLSRYIEVSDICTLINKFELYSKSDAIIVLNSLCETNDKQILELINKDLLNPIYNDMVLDSLDINDLTYEDIKNIPYSSLSIDSVKEKYIAVANNTADFSDLIDMLGSNRDDDIVQLYLPDVTKNVCDKYDSLTVYGYAEKVLPSDNLSKDILVSKISKCDYGNIIYDFTKNYPYLNKDDISILANGIKDTGNIMYIYLFLRDIHNIKKEDKKMLEKAILDSHNMIYICALALYIDTKLIDKLFKGKEELYLFILSSGIYKKINEVEFGGLNLTKSETLEEKKANIKKLIEESVIENIDNIDPKTYKMKKEKKGKNNKKKGS